MKAVIRLNKIILLVAALVALSQAYIFGDWLVEETLTKVSLIISTCCGVINIYPKIKKL